MGLTDQLCRLAAIWAAASERSEARLATIVANDGKFFTKIRGGSACNTNTFEKFLLFFRNGDNWPNNVIPAEASELLDNFDSIVIAAPLSPGKSGDVTGEGIAA